MPRKYRHIGDNEKEIIEMWTNGMTLREIGEKLGFTLQEMKDFKSRYNKKQRKIEAGKSLKVKGRPPKDYEVTEDMKVAELKYIIARKDSKIKRLEMENELMRDFLSPTERK